MWQYSTAPVRSILENQLDKDVLKIIQPFNIMLSLFFSSKYKIRDSYITLCDKKYHILIFTIISCCNVFSIYCIFQEAYDESEVNYRNGSVFSFFFYCLGYILLVICNICHSRGNISLVLKIQEIHRSIDISKSIPNYKIWNWIYFAVVFFFYIAINTFFYGNLKTIYFADITGDLLTVAYDINLVYGIRLMALLTKYLMGWVEKIHKLNSEENEEYCKGIYVQYRKILEGYQLHNKVFQELVSRYLLLLI